MPPRRDAPGAGRRVRPVDDRRAAPRRAPHDADRGVRVFFYLFHFLTFSLSLSFSLSFATRLFPPSPLFLTFARTKKTLKKRTGKRPPRWCSRGRPPCWLTTRRRNGKSSKRSIPSFLLLLPLLLLLPPRARFPRATRGGSPFWNRCSSSPCGCSHRHTS